MDFNRNLFVLHPESLHEVLSGMVFFEAHTLTCILLSTDSVCMTFFLFFCVLTAAFMRKKIIGLSFTPINWISINHDFKNHILGWVYNLVDRVLALHAQGPGFIFQHHVK